MMGALRALHAMASVNELQQKARLENERGSLRVHLQRAAGLLAADTSGTSDPYV